MAMQVNDPPCGMKKEGIPWQQQQWQICSCKLLRQPGVERVYGVSGDSLNGITDSIRRQRDRSAGTSVRDEHE
jgi:hypothetical protein